MRCNSEENKRVILSANVLGIIDLAWLSIFKAKRTIHFMSIYFPKNIKKLSLAWFTFTFSDPLVRDQSFGWISPADVTALCIYFVFSLLIFSSSL